MFRRSLLVLVPAALVLFAAPAYAAVPVLVVSGEGWGHGVGLAQDGAYWMGRAGATTGDILGHFYPGVSMGRAGGDVRVAVLSADSGDAVVTFPGGGEVRSPRDGAQAPGFPVAVPAGGAVRIHHDAVYHVLPGATVSARSAGQPLVLPIPTPTTPGSTTTTTSPVPKPAPGAPGAPGAATTTTTAPANAERTSAQPVWAVPAANQTIGVPARDARYRGAVEANAEGGPLRLIDQVDVEQYLRGMGEVRNPSWPAASLRTQAIVARTYALRAMRAGGEICDTERCQVYLGQQAEYPEMDKAVSDTAGQVLTWHGGLAAAVYSANGAGVSATPAEGFGTPDDAYPYLRAATYETHSPETWEMRISLADLASRLHYPGTITGARVATTGPSGRPLTVVLDGSAGPVGVSAMTVTDQLSLRSTKWTTRVELGDAPPPPPPGEGVQALPDDVAAALAASPAPAVTGTVAAAALAVPAGHHHWSPLGPIAFAAVALAAALNLFDPDRWARARR